MAEFYKGTSFTNYSTIYRQYGWNPTPNTRSRTQRRTGGTQGARFQQERGFLYGVGETDNNARRNRQAFTADNQQQKADNLQAAKELQEIVVRNIKRKIKRRAVSTGRLVEATDSPDNITAGFDFIGVGIPTHLDASQAKYWRTIEEGTARVWKRAFKGTPLPGLWADSISGFHMNAWGEVPTPSGNKGKGRRRAMEALRGRGTGKFAPFSPEGAAAYLAQSDGKYARVHHEIEPMNAYLEAWEEFGGAKRLLHTMQWMKTTGVRPGTAYVGQLTHTRNTRRRY